MASSDGGSLDQGPGEPEEGEGDPKDGPLGERALGGWVPPEQRAWRHPSETGHRTTGRPPGRAPLVHAGPTGRRTAWATSLVGAGAVAALVTGGLMLATHSGRGPITGAARTLSATPATQSIVRLDVATSTSNTYGCGVVVASDGLIATNATLLAGAQWIVATTSTGRRETATVVALDQASDVGLVSVGGSLPVARFVDWSEVQPGTGEMEMAVWSTSPGVATTAWRSGTVASAGDAVGSGPGIGMVSVVAVGPAGAEPDGAVLMQPDGAVVGILDRSGEPSVGTGSVFLPGQFVVQVARELMTNGGRIHHGWLGIDGTDPGAGHRAGALVTAVDKTGPSLNHLRRGDVIEAIDGHRVRSMADLRSRLYLLAPGARVDLRVERHDSVRAVGLALSPSP